MAGFISKPTHFASGGLGFASGMGSFIGGAAAKESQILDEQRKQGREDDLIWSEKFERGLRDYEKEKKDTDTQARMYNTFLSLSHGNKQLADVALNHVLANPKGYEDAVQMLTKNADKAQDPNYQSPFMDNMNSSLSGKYQNLQQMRGNLSPNAQKFATMPGQPQLQQQPYPNSDYGQQGPQPQTASSEQPPTEQPTIFPAGARTDAQGNPTPGTPQPTSSYPGAPDQMTPSPGQSTPQAQAQPIPSPQGTALGAPQPPVQTAQNQGLYGPRPETQRQMNQDDIARQQLEINKNRFEMEKNRKPATPEETANYAIQTQAAEKYLTDPKTGLQARYASLQDLQSSNYSISSIRDVLERGFKANSVQGAYDEFNRFFQGMFGTDLSTMGLKVNPTEDINVFKKDISNAIIDRLKTLHFGRITNYEAQIVKQGFSNPNNDPNTNIKIALTMQSSVRAAMQGIQTEYETAFGKGNPTLDIVAQARRSGIDYNNKYLKEHDNAPWVQFNDMQKSIPLVSSMESGTWFEDKQAGKMYRTLGVQGDFLKIEDASGQTYSIPAH